MSPTTPNSGQVLLLSSLNKDFLLSMETPPQLNWISKLEGIDVSEGHSRYGHKRYLTALPSLYNGNSVKNTQGWNNLFPEGRGVHVSLYTNTPKARARTHTMAPFPSRLHYILTIPSPFCSGGATTTRFPHALLAAGAAALLGRLVPGSRSRLRARPLFL